MCGLRSVWGALEGRTAAGVLDCSLGLLEEVWGVASSPEATEETKEACTMAIEKMDRYPNLRILSDPCIYLHILPLFTLSTFIHRLQSQLGMTL